MKRILKYDENEDENVYFFNFLLKEKDYKIDEEDDFIRILSDSKKDLRNSKESICFLRSKWINEPLPLS